MTPLLTFLQRFLGPTAARTVLTLCYASMLFILIAMGEFSQPDVIYIDVGRQERGP
jgi:hypothetical protein